MRKAAQQLRNFGAQQPRGIAKKGVQSERKKRRKMSAKKKRLGTTGWAKTGGIGPQGEGGGYHAGKGGKSTKKKRGGENSNTQQVTKGGRENGNNVKDQTQTRADARGEKMKRNGFYLGSRPKLVGHGRGSGVKKKKKGLIKTKKGGK